MKNSYDKLNCFMLVISLTRPQKMNIKKEYPIQGKKNVICNLMHHISHQQTRDHPFMWYAQMEKPCNQSIHVYWISHTYLRNHVRAIK